MQFNHVGLTAGFVGRFTQKVSKIGLSGLLTVAILSALPAESREYLVKYKKDRMAMAMFSTFGYTVQDIHEPGNLAKINLPESQAVEIMKRLYSSGDVEYIVPNIQMHAILPVAEGEITSAALKPQWHIQKIRAEEAWKKAGNHGSKNILVAVIDTGADYNHESLKPNMVPGHNFLENNSDPMDDHNHGTHCSGLIGATGVIEGGTVGVSPDVSVMPLRFLGASGGGDLANAIKAIDYAIDKGVSVISASWGGQSTRAEAQPLIEAIDRANKKGIVFVVAASNDSKDNDSYDVFPAKAGLSNVIAVAASDQSDARPYWSNVGRRTVDLASPGAGIMSTIRGSKYQTMDGTSMATPIVAGLVAFLKAQDTSLTPEQIKSILQSTGAKVDIQTQCQCRIDALAATEAVIDKKMYLVPAGAALNASDTLELKAYNASEPVQFKSSDEAILKIEGTKVVAVAAGEASITATDSAGKTAQTVKYIVGNASTSEPGNPGDPGQPGDDSCPFGDAATCQAMCGFMPDAPWCKK